MSVTYEPAPAVESIAARLITEHHHHLKGERIEYVFRSEAAKENGKTVWGKARKVSGLNAYLSRTEDDGDDAYFVIEIAADVWAVLDPDQRRALVDHELMHCMMTEDGKPAIKPHDVEEFKAVIERHGLWRPDVEAFVKTGYQLRLGDPVPDVVGYIEEHAQEISDELSAKAGMKVTVSTSRANRSES